MSQGATSGWLRGPLFDTACIAYGWVPFYLFVVFGLGLDGTWLASGTAGDKEPGLALAVFVALGITYVHRHYTFLLVYGDRETFKQRERAYTIVPAALFVAFAVIMRVQGDLRLELPGVPGSVRPWMLVLFVTGGWNIWHTVMQRHGIFRIYAGKAGGGLQERHHARLDRQLVWSAVAVTAALVVVLRQETFAGVGNARKLLEALAPLQGGVGIAVAGLVILVFGVVATRWAAAEAKADLAFGRRIPRLCLLSSTLALLGVFVLHGPVIGYLCFGTAHAIEYVFFFHLFGARKFERRPNDRSLAARILRWPLISFPVVAGSLLLAFWLLSEVRRTEAFLVYYTATSILHFLYDGWIWKVRKPEVSRPLGLSMPSDASDA